MNIPLQKPSLGSEELDAVANVFTSRWLGAGAITEQFEKRLQELMGKRHVAAVSSGTAALHLAFSALNAPPNSEVILPSLTFAATAQAVLMAGLKPIFCEVRPDDLNIDLDDAFSRVNDKTCAIVPVHFGGEVCELDLLLAEARRYGLRVIEDSAHAFGSTYRGRLVGSFGDVTAFSFDPIKNITCGEGGAVVTDDENLIDTIRIQRQLGIGGMGSTKRQDRAWIRGGSHHVISRGFRYHMPNLNASIGLVQLKSLKKFTEIRQSIARRYDEALSNIPGLITLIRRTDETCPFIYVVRVLGGRRAELMAHLERLGIGSGIHYAPCHLQPAFRQSTAALPITEELSGQIMTLPLFCEMTDAEVNQVIDAIVRFFYCVRA